MKNPSLLYRYMFVAAVGFLFVGMLFTVLQIPAAELFSVVGGLAFMVFYGLFSRAATVARTSNYARHAAVVAFVIGQVARSFDLEYGVHFFLAALIAILVWITWSVLEALPASEE